MTQTEFEHLLLKTRDKMMHVAMSFFHNKEDAEDVVQEVCVRMLERGWKSGDNIEALLIKATKNLCVSVWRRQKQQQLQQTSSFTPPWRGWGRLQMPYSFSKNKRSNWRKPSPG